MARGPSNRPAIAAIALAAASRRSGQRWLAAAAPELVGWAADGYQGMTRAFSSPRHLIAQRGPDGALWSLREASSRCLLRFHIHVSAGLVFASGSTALIAGSAAPGSRPGRHRLA